MNGKVRGWSYTVRGTIAALSAIGWGLMGVPAAMGQQALPTDASIAAAQADVMVKPPAFDVISVKPDKGGSGGGMIQFKPDGFTVADMPVHVLLTQGFQIEDDQVVGEPAWAKTELWNIDAKVAGTDVATLEKMTFDERRSMFLKILEDRFGLKVHHETRELPVYALVVAKGGVKMTESKPYPDESTVVSSGPGRLVQTGRGKLEGEGTSTSFLAGVLAGAVHRKVVDRTGLTGRYDFTLTWAPDEGAGAPAGVASLDESAPSIFTAVQEQLGLKLEPSKGPVDVIVIDRLEKPEQN